MLPFLLYIQHLSISSLLLKPILKLTSTPL
jgi:NADPH2:quinone reductase